MVRILTALLCAIAPIGASADPMPPAPAAVVTPCPASGVCAPCKATPMSCCPTAKECPATGSCREAIKQITKEGCCAGVATTVSQGCCASEKAGCACESCPAKSAASCCCVKTAQRMVHFNVIRMAPQTPNLTTTLIGSLSQVDCPDAFLLTLGILARASMSQEEATQATLVALQNAQRLGLTEGLFEVKTQEHPRAVILLHSIGQLAQKCEKQPTHPVTIPPAGPQPYYSPAASYSPTGTYPQSFMPVCCPPVATVQ